MLFFSSRAEAHSVNYFLELANFDIDLIQEALHFFIKLISLLVSECWVRVRRIRKVVFSIFMQDVLYFGETVQYIRRVSVTQLRLYGRA